MRLSVRSLPKESFDNCLLELLEKVLRSGAGVVESGTRVRTTMPAKKTRTMIHRRHDELEEGETCEERAGETTRLTLALQDAHQSNDEVLDRDCLLL